MRFAATFASVIAFSVCVAATPAPAFQSENTLRIGAMWAITGGVALTGKGALNLSKLAVNEINSAGGVMVGGKPVKLELYAYDEACKEQEGLALLSRLKDVDKVLFSLGPTCSGTAEPDFQHAPEDARRSQRQGRAIPVLHGYRKQVRAREDLAVGFPQYRG